MRRRTNRMRHNRQIRIQKHPRHKKLILRINSIQLLNTNNFLTHPTTKKNQKTNTNNNNNPRLTNRSLPHLPPTLHNPSLLQILHDRRWRNHLKSNINSILEREMKPKIIAQGAEAIINLKENKITKKRIKKSYRIPELDKKIRIRRTRAEAKIMQKISQLIPVPKIIDSNENTKEIKMEFINGKKLSQHLDKFTLIKQKQILKQIGESVAKLHKENIIHGDLTTSNLILKKEKVFLIDFGLGFQNAKYEDKAVDIHLLKQALEAKHFKHWEKLYKEFEKGYKKQNPDSKIIFDRLKAVEKRGKYRH